MSEQLTPQQIENWRNYLATLFGTAARIMPDEEIQAYRDKMQSMIDTSEHESPFEFEVGPIDRETVEFIDSIMK